MPSSLPPTHPIPPVQSGLFHVFLSFFLLACFLHCCFYSHKYFRATFMKLSLDALDFYNPHLSMSNPKHNLDTTASPLLLLQSAPKHPQADRLIHTSNNSVFFFFFFSFAFPALGLCGWLMSLKTQGIPKLRFSCFRSQNVPSWSRWEVPFAANPKAILMPLAFLNHH